MSDRPPYRRDPQQRRLSLLTRMLGVSGVATFAFVPFDWFFTGYRADALVEAAASLTFLGCFAALRRGADIDRVAWIACFAAVVAILVVVLGEGGEQAALAWAPVVPIPCLFLLGFRRGLTLVGLFAAAMLAGLLRKLALGAPGVDVVTIANGLGALTVSAAGAMVYEHSRLADQRELERAANLDFLTGLANRRHFQAHYERERARALRHGRPFCLLLFDIDHFKRINDTHGHEAGDEAIRHLAELLVANVRASDVVGRIGGEEFGVLLPETALPEALGVAEKLRRVVEATPRLFATGPLSFTVSVGVAEAELGHRGFSELFATADGNLYRAKRAGRNAVAVN